MNLERRPSEMKITRLLIHTCPTFAENPETSSEITSPETWRTQDIDALCSNPEWSVVTKRRHNWASDFITRWNPLTWTQTNSTHNISNYLMDSVDGEGPHVLAELPDMATLIHICVEMALHLVRSWSKLQDQCLPSSSKCGVRKSDGLQTDVSNSMVVPCSMDQKNIFGWFMLES